MFKFWKKKRELTSSQAMDAIKEAADKIRKELKQPVRERPHNPLWDLVMKAETYEDLDKLADEYQNSADIFFDIVLILKKYELSLNIAGENINILDKRVKALEEKPKKKSGKG